MATRISRDNVWPPANPEPSRRSRGQITHAACERCRKRKIKCDGQRPCVWCRELPDGCTYETRPGETRDQVKKRKYDDLERAHNSLLKLVDLASSRLDAPEILGQVKKGRDVDELLSFLQHGDVQYESNLGVSSRVRHLILCLFIQSTASLDEIVALAPRLIDESPGDDFLDSCEALGLKNRTIDGQLLAKPIQEYRAYSSTRADPEPDTSQPPVNARCETNVPAWPWTRLDADDGLVSHLVSIFLNYNNVYWRFVEEDLFLTDMQAGSIPAEYCSPFLVNAICALACMSSEHRAVYMRRDDFITRGQHFYDEALRLWLLEEGRSSLANLQALVIMAMLAGLKGKDKLGTGLLAIAVEMNKGLPFPSSSSETMQMSNEMRARACAAWATHSVDVSGSLGYLKTSAPIHSRLQFSPNLPEIYRVWTGEPFLNVKTIFRPNALMRERCQLVRLIAEMVNLFFTVPSLRSLERIRDEGFVLMTRMQQWYDLLPSDLEFSERLAAPLYELHTQYHAAMIALQLSLEKTKPMDPPLNTFPQPQKPPQPTTNVLKATLTAVQLLGHYRHRYGFKSSVPFNFQLAAVASSVLLGHLNPPVEAESGRQDAIDSVHAAFGESYRCLLAMGTRMMVARGFARMIYHTAKNSKLQFPRNAQRMLDVVAQVVWEARDVEHISSNLPIADSTGTFDVRNELRMEALLRKFEGVDITAKK